jgi:hypothetical protein
MLDIYEMFSAFLLHHFNGKIHLHLKYIFPIEGKLGYHINVAAPHHFDVAPAPIIWLTQCKFKKTAPLPARKIM